MISDVMVFARPPVAEPCEVELVASVVDVVQGVCDGHASREGRVQVIDNGPVTILADPVQLSVVVAELLTNALEADTEGGEVLVSVTGSESVVLEVRDRGPGLDAPARRHLFDPFFSGRQAGRGLGFGLPKCWRIVNLQGGRIEVEPNEPSGLCVRVSWPRSA